MEHNQLQLSIKYFLTQQTHRTNNNKNVQGLWLFSLIKLMSGELNISTRKHFLIVSFLMETNPLY